MLYQNILTISFIFLAAVTKISLFPEIFPGHIAPDILLILIIIWSTHKTFESFWLWAVFAGLILDAVSLERIGVNAISFLVISFGVDFLSRRFFISQRRGMFFWTAGLVCAGVITNYFLVGGIHLASGNLSAQFFSWHDLFFELLNNLIVFSLIYLPVTNFKSIFPIEKSRLTVK